MDDAELRERFLSWRRIEDPCTLCAGSGVRTYGSTATWRGGIGGAAMTTDVCDQCWGSGDQFRSGVDLIKLRNEESARIAEQAVDALARSAGATLHTSSSEVLAIVDVLKAAGNKRGKGIWFKPLCDSLASLLERAVKRTNALEGKNNS